MIVGVPFARIRQFAAKGAHFARSAARRRSCAAFYAVATLCVISAVSSLTALAQPTSSSSVGRATAESIRDFVTDSIDPARRAIVLAVRDVPVRDAIEALVSRSGISLMYASQSLTAAGTVSCRSDGESAEWMLRCIVRGAGLDYYRMSTGTFVVIPSAKAIPRYGTITGLIRDATTGQPIPQARVALTEQYDVRTASNGGSFSFTRLRPGRYRVMATAIGYRAHVAEVDVSDEGLVRTTLQLEPHVALVAPVVINGLVPGSTSGALATRTFDVSQIPMMVTGPSFLQSTAPAVLGVATASGRGDLHIQGGATGEHQVRLDGIPIFDPLAIDRLYGAFSPLAIGRLTVRRAGFGAQDGSFTAGVVDLEHAMPTSQTAPHASWQMVADQSSAAGQFAAQRSIGGRALRSMVSARTSLWSWYQPAVVTSALREWNMMSPVLTERLADAGLLGHQLASSANGTLPITRSGTTLDFTDVHGAISWDAGNFSSVSASAYVGHNSIGTDVLLAPIAPSGIDTSLAVSAGEGYRWHTSGAQIRYETLVGARSSLLLRARHSDHALRYGFMLGPMTTASSTPLATDHNDVRETAVEGALTTSIGEQLHLVVQTDVANTASRMIMANGILRDLRSDLSVWRASGAVDATWHVRSGLWLETGVRNTWLLDGGRSATEPRVALRGEGEWPVFGRHAWRIAGGTYRQFVTQFDVATAAPNALTPTLRFWLPVDASTPTPRAHHVAGELVVHPHAGWEVRGEVYRKWQPVIAAFDYGVLLNRTTSLPHQLSPSAFISTSRGDAWGGGIRVVRELRQSTVVSAAREPLPTVRAEVGYDYGVSRRTFPSRFGGTLQPAPWNEPHRVTAAIDWYLPQQWLFTLRSRLVDGRPWALRQAYYDLLAVSDLGSGLPVQDPGQSRKPLLATTDVGLSRTLHLGGTRIEVGAGVLNVFGRRNVLDYGLQRTTDPSLEGSYTQVPRFLLGRQWSLSVRAGRH